MILITLKTYDLISPHEPANNPFFSRLALQSKRKETIAKRGKITVMGFTHSFIDWLKIVLNRYYKAQLLRARESRKPLAMCMNMYQ